MSSDERIAGVTFRFKDSEVINSTPGKSIARVQLDAEIVDWELWEQVQQKLDGLRLYAVEDFKTELIAMLQDSEEQLESELVKRKGASSSLQEENKLLRARVAELEVLERQFQELLGA